MTPDQMTQLKAMSPYEVVKKYFPMLMDNKITLEQYNRILGITKVPEAESESLQALQVAQESFPNPKLI